MRFVVTGEWSRNRLLKVIVCCFLAYTLILWVTNFGLYFAKMSLTPSSVIEYYRGNEEKFLPPRSLQGLWEILHFHSFAMGILLMTLTHLVLFVPISMRAKAWGIATAFVSGIGGELSGWGVRFLHPELRLSQDRLLSDPAGRRSSALMVLVARALLTERAERLHAGQRAAGAADDMTRTWRAPRRRRRGAWAGGPRRTPSPARRRWRGALQVLADPRLVAPASAAVFRTGQPVMGTVLQVTVVAADDPTRARAGRSGDRRGAALG